jgi:hypothetical protein
VNIGKISGTAPLTIPTSVSIVNNNQVSDTDVRISRSLRDLTMKSGFAYENMGELLQISPFSQSLPLP